LAIASIFSNKAREIAMTLIRGGADVNLADNDGISPLHVAVVCNMREIIEALCNANAELNPRNEEGETPLEWAIQFDHHEAEALLRARGAVL
jgi:ankyrin repeat protein